MIVVTIELRSAVSRDRDKVLGVVGIANDGTGDADRASYDAVASRGPRGKSYVGRVEGFPKKSRSALELLRRALNAMHENGGLP